MKEGQKIKKGEAGAPTLSLVENPDILAQISKKSPRRPTLVIGFAAETENVEANAKAKLARKGCDLIVANSVAEGASAFGSVTNQVSVVDANQAESWPTLSKSEVAERIVGRMIAELAKRG